MDSDIYMQQIKLLLLFDFFTLQPPDETHTRDNSVFEQVKESGQRIKRNALQKGTVPETRAVFAWRPKRVTRMRT